MMKPFSLVVVLLAALVLPLSAQADAPVLTGIQPVSVEITEGQAIQLTYVLNKPSHVVLQAISGTVHPVLEVLQDGRPVVSATNATGDFTVTLEALLTGGTYTIEVSGADATTGLVIVSVLAEKPVEIAIISSGIVARADLTPDRPLAVFEFTDLPEKSHLQIESGLDDLGVDVRLVNLTLGGLEIGSSTSDALGVRFTLAAGSDVYQVWISTQSGRDSLPFELCLTSASTSVCGANPAETTAVVPLITEAGCTASAANAGGVNIRQSASTNAVIIGTLTFGQNAPVEGISPDGTFYRIAFNVLNGWVARSVVTTSGPCDGLQIITPPPVQSPPTAVPQPTQVPQPTSQPTPSGPCLITVNSPTYVYTTTIAQVDYLQDQVSVGELIPTGRTADNTWWKTNYANSWIQTSTFGHTVTVTGNCGGLPVVSP